MNNRNFSDVMLKLDGNTTRAVNKFVKQQNNQSYVLEYEQNADSYNKNYNLKKHFPFNQTEKRSDWMIGNSHFLNNPLNGRKKLANQSLKKSLSGILSGENNYYSNNNDTTSKSIYFDTANENNIVNQKQILLYKNNNRNNNSRSVDLNNSFSNFYNNYNKPKSSVMSLKKRNIASEFLDKTNTCLKDYPGVNYAKAFKIYSEHNSQDHIFNNKTANDNDIKPNNKITLLFQRSKGPQINYLWEKEASPINKRKNNSIYKGWVTKDSGIFNPSYQNPIGKRKLTKSVDLNSIRKERNFAGLKYKQIGRAHV